jgi:hypothetical protein
MTDTETVDQPEVDQEETYIPLTELKTFLYQILHMLSQVSAGIETSIRSADEHAAKARKQGDDDSADNEEQD